jgi:hypothetical protein
VRGPVNVSYKRHPVLSIRTPEEMLSNIQTIKRNNNVAKMASMFFKSTFSIFYENSWSYPALRVKGFTSENAAKLFGGKNKQSSGKREV